MHRILSLPLAAAVLLGLSASVATAAGKQSPGAPGGVAASTAAHDTLAGSGPLTPKQRGQIAREFVTKWAPYFEAAYDQPAERWAMKQARRIGLADADNLRSAMKKDTLEAAMLAISGQDISDGKVINYLADKGDSGTLALGDLAADLVFTPLAPCRIFDTRVTGGIVNGGSTRSFDTFPFAAANFAYQGGSAAGNCGMNPDAAAVVLNIAAPNSSSGGFLTVFPFGTTRPLASNLDYSAGALANSEIIAKSANSTWDITVYVHGTSHIVGDVVGYMIRPEATALNCFDTTLTITPVAAGATANSVAPDCAVGFTPTATNCQSTTFDMPFVFISNGTCSARNLSASAASIRSSRTCCRVPGR